MQYCRQAETIDPTNARLVGVVAQQGWLQAPYSLSYRILDVTTAAKVLEPVQVWPDPDDGLYAPIDLVADALVTGRYAATWEVASDEPEGGHEIHWSAVLTEGATPLTWFERMDVVAGEGRYGDAYAFVSDLRDEGVAVADLSDHAARLVLARASRQIERWTRRVFVPSWRELRLDGNDATELLLDQPIIALSSITMDGLAVDPTEVLVYCRHLSQGLRDPDDRDCPRLAFTTAADQYLQTTWSARCTRTWRRSRQNVAVAGLFGYTDPDPDSMVGQTPDLLRRVTCLLAYRDAIALTSDEDRFDRLNRHRLTAEQTRDQNYRLSDAGQAGQGWTGDPEIDRLIAAFQAPPRVRAV